ncbi:glycosyltransferase [Thermopolyspora flexuosa]|uniref:glycosyltransferase n=1 Tax=Thermopolyspora flexuosa TaxID=103836 RepID=UPI001E379691|nr:glycosyltransferase [Thermopolyspora flexuosa]
MTPVRAGGRDPVVFVAWDAEALGGVQRVTHTLAQGLAVRGHEVHVVGIHRSAAPFRHVAEPGYHRHVLQGRLGRPSRRRLAALLGALRSGYVVLTSPGTVAWAREAIPRHLFTVGQYHGSYEHARSTWHLRSIRRHYPELDQAVFLSPEDAWRFTEDCLLPNAADVPNPLPVWPARTSPLTAPRVLGVGRLAGVKRFDRLISAFAAACRAVPERWELHLVGEGEDEPRLREHAAAEGVADRVTFHGRVPAERMPLLYLHGSILALTSDHEGLPLAVAEAASYGVPAVAFDVSSGVRAVAARTVPPGDLAAFTAELTALMADLAARRRLGAAARDRVAAYRPGHVLDRWEELFARLRL